MVGHRRRIRTAALAAASVVIASAMTVAPAQASTQDEQFIEAVNSLDIPFAEGTDLPAMGRGMCENLAASTTTGFRNPVTAVRGLVSTLESSGMTRSQAVGIMQIAVAFYCPEYRAFMPR